MFNFIHNYYCVFELWNLISKSFPQVEVLRIRNYNFLYGCYFFVRVWCKPACKKDIFAHNEHGMPKSLNLWLRRDRKPSRSGDTSKHCWGNVSGRSTRFHFAFQCCTPSNYRQPDQTRHPGWTQQIWQRYRTVKGQRRERQDRERHERMDMKEIHDRQRTRWTWLKGNTNRF